MKPIDIFIKFLRKSVKKDGFIINYDGDKYIVGQPLSQKPIEVYLNKKNLPLKLILCPDLYFGEAYVNSDIVIKNGNISDFFESKNYQSAISALTLAIELEPNYAEAYNKRATFYFMMGDYENSMRDIEATLYLEPRHFGALDGLSRILISYKNYDGALKVYQEMKKLMPNDLSVDLKIENLNQMVSKET